MTLDKREPYGSGLLHLRKGSRQLCEFEIQIAVLGGLSLRKGDGMNV